MPVMAAKPGHRRRKPAAWDTTKSEYFLKWDAIRGEQIHKDALEFFIQAKDKLDKPFDDPEDKELFIQNVFSQTSGEEVPLVKNSLASQIVEQLIPTVSDEALLPFAAALYQCITELSEDQFASHVLQTLLLSMTCRVQAGTSSLHSDLETWVLTSAEQLQERLPALAGHQYGSHVLRTCLECLAGCRAPQQLTRSRSSQQQRWKSRDAQPVLLDKQKTPPSFTEKFVEMAKAVKNLEGLGECLADQNFSTVVQLVLNILYTLPMLKLSRKLIKRLSKLYFGGSIPEDPTVLPSVFENESLLRVLEAALVSCEEDIFQKLYRKYYRGRLRTLMQENVSSISVQRLVEACPGAEALESVLEELEADPATGWWTTTRVPTALALACVRLHSHQARLMKLAARLCDCESAERAPQLAPCVLYRTTWTEFQRLQGRLASVEIAMDGSLLLQAMLKFSKPTKLITSFLSLRADQLVAVLQSPAGSHVIDALVTSQHMGDKGKTRLLEILKEELVPLACSKHGSRALDALWGAGSPAHRSFIAETLAPQQAQLRDHFFGKFAVRNFALPLFVKKRADWTAYVRREANKRKMFADLLPAAAGGGGGGGGPGPRAAAARRGAAPAKRPRAAATTDALFVIDRSGVQAVLDDLE
ncbi:nucleolar protein 9-like [Pollicipes pollicipes]|uniref:nucleolar protein 9-like n=1 Tax=Pollicipes pollicipes TaxID=41117 RepID=UPI0018858AFF|nr:nucleolar protein 9-like [Pollicipes pollicipes]